MILSRDKLISKASFGTTLKFRNFTYKTGAINIKRYISLEYDCVFICKSKQRVLCNKLRGSHIT